MRSIVICGVVVLMFAADVCVHALQCHTCSGVACGDPFNASAATTMTCNDPGSCIKTTGNDGLVIRFCSGLRFKEGCDDDDDAFDISCACDDSFCNKGASMTSSITTPILIAIFTLLWYRLRGL